MTIADLIVRTWRHFVGFFALMFLFFYRPQYIAFIVVICALAALGKAFARHEPQRQSDESCD